MQSGKLTVGIGKAEWNWPARIGPATSYFGEAVFKAVRKIDTATKFRAGNGIDDGFAAGLDQAVDLQTRTPLIDIHLEFNIGKYRLMKFCQCGREDLEDRCARVGVLAGEDSQQSFALLGT